MSDLGSDAFLANTLNKCLLVKKCCSHPTLSSWTRVYIISYWQKFPHFKTMRFKWSFSSPGWSGITRTSWRTRLDPSPFIWCFFVFRLLFDPAVKHPSTLCVLLNVTGLHYSDLLTYTDLLVWQRPSIIRDCHGLPNPLKVYTPPH